MIAILDLILFLWSFTCLLYALIKRHETAIETFVILTAMLFIKLNDIVYFSNYSHLEYIFTLFYGFEP